VAGKKRILILDDSAITLELEKSILEERGYEVAAAENLVEFELRLADFQPEIILTDVVMPDVSGQDIVRVLKQDYATEKIPIVLFSSKPEEELERIARQAGADGHLSKSRGIESLGDMVDELVDSIIW